MKSPLIKIFILVVVQYLFGTAVFCQQKTRFISSEVMLGKIVKNYERFPGSDIRKTFQLNIGTFLHDSSKHSQRYYHFPHVGISLGASNLGNDENLGNEFSLVPYISLNASKGFRHSLQFKFGLGTSYFTKMYDKETNNYNRAIGSSFTWTFQAFAYYHVLLSEHWVFQAGAGFWHSSNSHIQIPNYGLNSAMVSVGFQYYLREIKPGFSVMAKQPKLPKKHVVQSRFGSGIHEFGATEKPTGGPKYPVFTLSGDYGFLYNQQLKFYGGFFYRYYSSFRHYISENYTDETHPVWQSSNINFHLGMEYLLGHVGMNLEGGINIYKPFYSKFYDIYEEGDPFNKFRMSTINTRLGLNLYLKNTSKNPQSNLALGAHINANFGKADFGELGFTYVRRVR